MGCEQAAKTAIINHSTAVSNEELTIALEERRSTHS
jgi:hypothetical protein